MQATGEDADRIPFNESNVFGLSRSSFKPEHATTLHRGPTHKLLVVALVALLKARIDNGEARCPGAEVPSDTDARPRLCCRVLTCFMLACRHRWAVAQDCHMIGMSSQARRTFL